ncbi:MAG: DUF2844 domain-containing protein [Steroidobacteraceae bacterium]
MTGSRMIVKHLPTYLAAAALTLAAALAAAPPALAALGGTVDSVTADSSTLKGRLQNTPQVNYDEQVITAGAVVVHEYVARSGQVFAVTWQGTLPPDLRQLLGSYFAQFQSAAAADHRAHPGMHRQLNVSQSDLVVEASGRLRAFQGLAYIPSLVPAGVVVSELQ